MRTFILLLLAANVGFFAWFYSNPPPKPIPLPSFWLPEGVKPLVMVSESSSQATASPTLLNTPPVLMEPETQESSPTPPSAESLAAAHNATKNPPPLENSESYLNLAHKVTELFSTVVDFSAQKNQLDPVKETEQTQEPLFDSAETASTSDPLFDSAETTSTSAPLFDSAETASTSASLSASGEETQDTATDVLVEEPSPHNPAPYAPVLGSDRLAQLSTPDAGTPPAQASQKPPHWTKTEYLAAQQSAPPSPSLAPSNGQPEKSASIAAPVTSSQVLPKAPPVSPEVTAQETAQETAIQCYRSGMLTEESAAQAVQAWFAKQGIKVEIDSQRSLLGYRVFLPPVSSRAGAERIAQVLHQRGFEEARVFSDDDLQDAVSIGFYPTQADAQVVMKQLKSQGYATIQSQALYPFGEGRFYLVMYLPASQAQALIARYRSNFQHNLPTVCKAQ